MRSSLSGKFPDGLYAGQQTTAPLSPLKPRSDMNSVPFGGIKGKVFSGPLFPHFEQKGHINKAEHQRINAFGLWCWRRLLRVP